MDKKLKEVIKNAKESTLKHDGYDKVIIKDKNGDYSFGRDYDDYPLFDGELIVGRVVGHWNNNRLEVKYIKQ